MKITPTNQWSYSQNEEYWDNDFSHIICPNCGDKVLTWAMCATDFADYRIK